MNSSQPAHPAAPHGSRRIFSWAGPLLSASSSASPSCWPAGASSPIRRGHREFCQLGHFRSPKLLTPFVSSVECFGGAMLILGLFTRIPAAMLAVVMIVAIKSAKWGDVIR